MAWRRAVSSQAAVAASTVSRTTTWTVTVRSISSKGRPTSAQRPRKVSPSCAIRSGGPKPFHRSAYRAVVRRVLVGPEPPMRIGRWAWSGRGGWAGGPGAAVGTQRVAHRIDRALMGQPFAVEQAADEAGCLVEPVEPLPEARAEVDAEGVVLALEPAATEPEHDSPAR